MTNYKKSLKDQMIDPYYQEKPTSYMIYITCCLIAGLLFMVAAIRSCNPNTEPIAVKRECSSCHNRQMVMTQYFKRNGSKTPEEMANAVLRTRNPKLLAAVAVVETGGTSTLRSTGYKNRHHGAFQVNPKHWGEVPKDAVGQALQAERILEELTDTMPIKKALSLYGGDSTSKYQRKVLAELVRVP